MRVTSYSVRNPSLGKWEKTGLVSVDREMDHDLSRALSGTSLTADSPGFGEADAQGAGPLAESHVNFTWAWVKLRPQVLVHVSIYQGSILGTYL